MKTAVSIPDPIFERADAHAKRLRVSRSELYARALEAFIANEDRSWITAAYDQAYGERARTSRYGDADDDTLAFARTSARRSARGLTRSERR